MRFLGGPETTALGRPRTFLNVVLDESSSMDSVREATIRAYNDFIAAQRAASATAKDEVFVTLTTFADAGSVHTLYSGKPLLEVPPLTKADYAPKGMTALCDGVANSIFAMERKVGAQARVLCLVITDGNENNSVSVDIPGLKRMVSQRTERGNWTFVFLSAGENPYEVGQDMGFQLGNISSYAADEVGTALATVSTGVASYRHTDALQTDTFYAGEAPTHTRPQWTQAAGDEDVEDVV